MDNFQQNFDQAINKYANTNAFGVSTIPAHVHNGTDSLHVNFRDLDSKQYVYSFAIQGTAAATATNYSVFFIAPQAMRLTGALEIHSTAGTAGGSVTLNIEKLTGTQASGAGTALLSTAFNLKGTANTLQTGSLVQATSGIDPKVMALGDRLGFVLTGTPTSVANVIVSITVSF